METKEKETMIKWLVKALDLAEQNPFEWNLISKEVHRISEEQK